jgi:thiol-disulfide isomerase/thioredoxin
MERMISIFTFFLFGVPVVAFVYLSQAERQEAFSTPVHELQGSVVMYYTPSCGACKIMHPVVQQAINKGYHISTVNLKLQPKTWEELHIRRVPTFIYYEHGVEKFRTSGSRGLPELELLCRGIR